MTETRIDGAPRVRRADGVAAAKWRSARRAALAGLAAVGVCGALAGGLAAPLQARAQAPAGRPKAELTAAVDRETVRAGETVRATLRVRLPEGVHTQSDKPRDQFLIPTVLTIDAPAGVTAGKVRYPAATDLTQAGQQQPLAVFEQDFTISVDLTLAKDVAPGDLTVPGRLRYQACDENMCYPPTRAETRWTLHVAGAPPTP